MGFSIWQLIISILVLIAVGVVVFGQTASKAGFSRWWALVIFVPLINFVAIWVFAFIRWPAEDAE